MAVTYPGINDPRIPELRPNLGLISLREQFGIPGEFLLSDDNQYFTNMNDNTPIEKIDDGIGSIINKDIIPPLIPLNFYNDNDRDNINMGLGSPDLELENMYEDEDRFNDIVNRKKMGIMELLQNIPTPLNLAKKGIETFRNYQEQRKIEKQREIEAQKILEQMKQERIKNEQRQAQQRQEQIDRRIKADANQRYRDDPGAQSYSGGFDRSTNNYNDPFSPGDTE